MVFIIVQYIKPVRWFQFRKLCLFSCSCKIARLRKSKICKSAKTPIVISETEILYKRNVCVYMYMIASSWVLMWHILQPLHILFCMCSFAAPLYWLENFGFSRAKEYLLYIYFVSLVKTSFLKINFQKTYNSYGKHLTGFGPQGSWPSWNQTIRPHKIRYKLFRIHKNC